MAFTPRLDSSGMMNNPYWYSGNPFWLSPTTPPHDLGLPNCTCYAWGRAWESAVQCGATNPRPEIYNNLVPDLSNASGRAWYGQTNWNKGQTPRLGAIVCYADTGGGAGHVAVVEEIDNDGNITCSNSAYGGQYFFVTHSTRANNYEDGYIYVGSGLPIFQGFIYNPFVDEPTPPEPPTPTPTGGKKNIYYLSKKIWLRKRGHVWL